MAGTPQTGKVAIVEIAAPGQPSVLMVEIALDGETLTISDDRHEMTDAIREAAQRLIEQVRTHYG